jgi:hypothetical protein
MINALEQKKIIKENEIAWARFKNERRQNYSGSFEREERKYPRGRPSGRLEQQVRMLYAT